MKIGSKSNLFLGVLIILLGLVASLVEAAGAAKLRILPSASNLMVGDSFSVQVVVDSPKQAMNAAEGVVEFSDNLTVRSISKAGTIFNFWVDEPKVNGNQIKFSGVVFSPGWQGQGGKLFTIVFQARSAGDAKIDFTAGNVLASDGKGTSIIDSLIGAQVVIDVKTEEKPAQATSGGIPGAPPPPRVSSPTHPNPEAWYANNDPQFSWQLSGDIKGVSVKVDRYPLSDPGPLSDGLFDSISYNDLADGRWYFHLKLKNDKGWGGISHFAFNIDTAKPTLEIKEEERKDRTMPRAVFILSAKDDVSDIDYYLIQIDSSEKIKWRDDGSHRYITPPLRPGDHIMVVQAFDLAGNSSTAVADFIVDPLQVPLSIQVPGEIKEDELLVVKGSTAPGHDLILWVGDTQGRRWRQDGHSNDDGSFVVALDQYLDRGVYKVWLEVQNKEGATSNPSARYTVVVTRSPLLSIGKRALDVLSIIVSLLSLAVLGWLLLWYSRRKYKELKQEIKSKTRSSHFNIHHALSVLKKDCDYYLKRTEHIYRTAELSPKEREEIIRLRQDLQKLLDEICRNVHKEISNITEQIDDKDKKK